MRRKEHLCLTAQASQADKPHACMQPREAGWPQWRLSLDIPEATQAMAEYPTIEEAAGLSRQKKKTNKPTKKPNQNRTEPEATAVEEAGGNWTKSSLFRDTTTAPYNSSQIQSIFVGICIL